MVQPNQPCRCCFETKVANDKSEIGVAVRVTRLEYDKAIFDITVDDKVRSK